MTNKDRRALTKLQKVILREMRILEQSGIEARMDGQALADMNAANKEAADKDVEKANSFDSKFDLVKIPPNKQTNKDLAIPKGSKTVLWSHPIEPTKVFGFGKWEGTQWDSYIPSRENLERIFPAGTLRQFTDPSGAVYMGQVKRVNKPPQLEYIFDWFYNKEGKAYVQPVKKDDIPTKYQPDTWWQEWGPMILQVTAAIIAGILTSGASIMTQLIAQGVIDLAFVGYQLHEGDQFGAALSLILAFVPFLSHTFKIGFNSQVLKSLISKVEGKSAKAVQAMMESPKFLSQEEKQLFKSVFNIDKDQLVKATSKEIYKDILTGVKDGKIVLEKIPFKQRAQWKRFVWDLSVSAGVVGGGLLYKYFEGKADARKNAAEFDAAIQKLNKALETPADSATVQQSVDDFFNIEID